MTNLTSWPRMTMRDVGRAPRQTPALSRAFVSCVRLRVGGSTASYGPPSLDPSMEVEGLYRALVGAFYDALYRPEGAAHPNPVRCALVFEYRLGDLTCT